jgi:hypothetical protein
MKIKLKEYMISCLFFKLKLLREYVASTKPDKFVKKKKECLEADTHI